MAMAARAPPHSPNLCAGVLPWLGAPGWLAAAGRVMEPPSLQLDGPGGGGPPLF